MNVSNKLLLNASKCQGYSFYRFLIIKGKPTGGSKITPLPPPRLGWNSTRIAHVIGQETIVTCCRYNLTLNQCNRLNWAQLDSAKLDLSPKHETPKSFDNWKYCQRKLFLRLRFTSVHVFQWTFLRLLVSGGYSKTNMKSYNISVKDWKSENR